MAMEKKRNKRNRLFRAALCLVTAGILGTCGIVLMLQRQRAAQEESIAAGEPQTADAASLSADPEAPAPGGSETGLFTYKGRKYRYNDHLSHFLFLGVDTTGDINTERKPVYAGQSDTLMLLSYDRKEESLQLISIPRDTMTQIAYYSVDGDYIGREEGQITVQYAFGDGKHKSCELTRDVVSDLFYGLRIQGYAAINLSAMPVLADVLGGVELVVPDHSMEDAMPEFKEGAEVTLTSENTERFLRHRDRSKPGQALVRSERQKAFVKAFGLKLKRMQIADASTVKRVYERLRPYMVTNMTNDLFADLATADFDGGIRTVPGEMKATEEFDEYHVDEDALYEMMLEMFYNDVTEEEGAA